MAGPKNALSRRNFVRAMVAIGLPPTVWASCLDGIIDGRMSSSRGSPAASRDAGWLPGQRIPKRPFGSTGDRVSILALGGFVDTVANPEILDLAYAQGITYWETTLLRGGQGYGAYFARHPDHRANIFLLAKTRGPSAATAEADLVRTLSEIGSGYVDFFIIQGIDDPTVLGPEIRDWAERAKREGRIRFFGFSTHSNMQSCLASASKLDWIDGAMTTYNYRLMQDPAMEDAIAACADRGIAITAIKSQALPTNPVATLGAGSAAALRFLSTFEGEDANPFEVRLRAVWSNPNVASICSMMSSRDEIEGNAKAARQGPLAMKTEAGLSAHARTTAATYCMGCTTLCQRGSLADVPIGDVMRYLMYARGYGDPARARDAFARMPRGRLATLTNRDYSKAERDCPQGLPIAALMDEALRDFAQEA
jgi:hypothetical protein